MLEESPFIIFTSVLVSKDRKGKPTDCELINRTQQLSNKPYPCSAVQFFHCHVWWCWKPHGGLGLESLKSWLLLTLTGVLQ